MLKITREMIMEELENRGYAVEAYDKVTNGVIINGIVIKKGNICPVVYVNSFIEEAEDMNLTLEEVTNAIESVFDRETPDIDIDKLLDTGFVLDNVLIGVQKESTEDLLRRESEFEGIESYLYVQIDEACSFKLNRGQLRTYNLTEEELWNKAEENTRRDTVVKSMASVMSEMMGVRIPEDEAGGLYVVTNTSKYKGAYGALDRELMKGLAYKLGVKGFAVLPSSIHEMLLIPFEDEREVDMKMLNEMVWQVNHTEVEPEERLTDRAYMYQF